MTLIAMSDQEGYVFGSASGLARICALPVELVIRVMKKLSSPDPFSSDLLDRPSNEGRRIEEVGGGWRLINYEHYRELKDADEQRQLARERKRKQRKRDSHNESVTSSDGKGQVTVGHVQSHNVTPSEAETEAKTEPLKNKRERERFAPPSLEDVREYGKEIPGLAVEAFFDYYASKGWIVGKSPMKDWRAAARRWRRSDAESGKLPTPQATRRDDEAATRADKDAAQQRKVALEMKKVTEFREEYLRLKETDPEAAKTFREESLKALREEFGS